MTDPLELSPAGRHDLAESVAAPSNNT